MNEVRAAQRQLGALEVQYHLGVRASGRLLAACVKQFQLAESIPAKSAGIVERAVISVLRSESLLLVRKVNAAMRADLEALTSAERAASDEVAREYGPWMLRESD